jgi:hypothetical protein
MQNNRVGRIDSVQRHCVFVARCATSHKQLCTPPTGEFRGVLHRHCNLGLGTFRDNIELLEYAVTYLRKFERRTH